MEPTEETPLLTPPSNDELETKSDAVYDRFNSREKKLIVALVSWCGLMPLFVSGCFFPSVPQIARDLESTATTISLSISLSIFAAAIGGLSAASYSSYYGRRPVYLCGMAVLFVGSLGVTVSYTIPHLMFWRFMQAFGASPGLSVGAGVIGDIYKLEERGTAMGVFLAACLLGPALAPPAGGMAAHYASWRIMQFILGVCGLVGFIGIYLCFPETSQPNTRGIDKWRSGAKSKMGRPKFVFLNPLEPMWLLRNPNMMAVSIASFVVLLTDFVMIVPLAYTIGERYQIKNDAWLGACFLPMGIGNSIGSPIAGRISDKAIVAWRDKRGGIWYPEDRLRSTLFASAVLVPLSVLLSGWIIHFVDGPIGLALNLLCLFMNGVGVQMVLGLSASYLVDVMHSRSAESVAANTGFRSCMVSLAIAGILPMIDQFGVVATNTLSALLAWIGFGILWCTVRYGNEMRAWTSDIEV